MSRTVIVSGRGTGIGKEIARTFANSGDSVVIVGRREKILYETAELLNQEVRTKEGQVKAFPADFGIIDSVTEVTKSIIDNYKEVDIIINNAGGIDRNSNENLKQIADSWMSDFKSNVLTSVLLTESLLPNTKKLGGKIINMSSIAALRGGGGSYSAAKSAIIGWTYDLAKKLGKEGISVNAIAPGYIAETEFFGSSMTIERQNKFISETFDGKPGKPEDVAATALFLASEKASQITGQIVQINGGALLGR